MSSLHRQLDTDARTVAEHLSPHTAAAFLRWHGTMMRLLQSHEQTAADHADNLRQMRNEIQRVIYDALNDYVISIDTDRDALTTTLTAIRDEQRAMAAVLQELADRSTRVADSG